MSDYKIRIHSLDEQHENIEKQLENLDRNDKESNRAYHDGRAEQQRSWEQAGARDEDRDR